MFAKVFVIGMLLMIVGSLLSALVFLYKDRGRSTRVVTALTIKQH